LGLLQISVTPEHYMQINFVVAVNSTVYKNSNVLFYDISDSGMPQTEITHPAATKTFVALHYKLFYPL
jgi:hypothetical protein